MEEKNKDIVIDGQQETLLFQVAINNIVNAVSSQSSMEAIFQSLTGKNPIRLTWTHYRIILQENSKEARDWYEQEAAREMWGTRTLQRNVSSQYYHRLLKSQNKAQAGRPATRNRTAEGILPFAT